MNPEDILKLSVPKNDSGQLTIGGYLIELLSKVWEEEESFSGKRPFGNSGWKYDLRNALVKHGVVDGNIYEEDGYEEIDCTEIRKADELIAQAILCMYGNIFR